MHTETHGVCVTFLKLSIAQIVAYIAMWFSRTSSLPVPVAQSGVNASRWRPRLLKNLYLTHNPGSWANRMRNVVKSPVFASNSVFLVLSNLSRLRFTSRTLQIEALSMLQFIIGTMLVVSGVIAFTSADTLSAFEKRLLDTHSWTRVTGWAGTQKGVLAWRGVGILLVLCGAWVLVSLFSLNLGR
jgi:hypothetical protein